MRVLFFSTLLNSYWLLSTFCQFKVSATGIKNAYDKRSWRSAQVAQLRLKRIKYFSWDICSVARSLRESAQDAVASIVKEDESLLPLFIVVPNAQVLVSKNLLEGGKVCIFQNDDL